MFYAVANGRQNGIYATWSECREQVLDFQIAVSKSLTIPLTHMNLSLCMAAAAAVMMVVVA